MKKVILSLCVVAAISACGGSDHGIEAVNGEVQSAVSSDEPIDEKMLAEIKAMEKEEEQRSKELEQNMTSLKYDKLIHDFGKVKQGSENTTQFKVTNTGTKPLIIDDVSASCGCTLPKKPEKPIAPGQSDVIEVTFKPKPGQANEIIKTVTVTANTDPRVSKLEIKAFVVE